MASSRGAQGMPKESFGGREGALTFFQQLRQIEGILIHTVSIHAFLRFMWPRLLVRSLMQSYVEVIPLHIDVEIHRTKFQLFSDLLKILPTK